MSANPYKAFGLSCPNGGDFHICENTKREFIGCCTMDPCADGSGLCEKTNLRAASFSEASYLAIPPQSCDSTGGDDHFYTCTANDPPFIGCCTLNPCVNMTCPSENLRAAVLSSNHDYRASFLSPSSSSSGSKSTTAKNSGSNGLSSAAIAGIVIGILAFVILVVGFMLWRRREWPFKSTKTRDMDTSSTKSAKEALMDSPKTPWSGHTHSSAFTNPSPMSDPRSALYPPVTGSSLPSYQQYKPAGYENSPNGQWHIPQHTPPPPPTFQPQRDDSRTWPFQSPLYDTYPSPPSQLPHQRAWPGRQSVHELLAEVQSAKTELPAQERAQELRSSCVVQPLRPPPPLKGLGSPVVPDSPTLGPVVIANGAKRKPGAVKDSESSDRSPREDHSAQEGSSTESPRPRQAMGGLRKKKQADLAFDSSNFI